MIQQCNAVRLRVIGTHTGEANMCGIAGRVGRVGSDPLSAKAVESLRHRGPDAQQSRRWANETRAWELAFARLAIVDLSNCGDQPMANEDESLVMVFNGEIYNAPELREYCKAKGHHFKSSMDGEVILHLYELAGSDAFRRLNGIFSVAIASTISGDIVLARDPVGVKPLFYCENDGELWFASELSTLIAVGAPIGPLDTVAMAQFLSFLWIPDPRTPHANAKSLLPGHMLRMTAGGTRLLRYCDPLQPSEFPRAIRPRDAVLELRERLVDAMQRQLLSDVPIGLMASGGVDSSLIWWASSSSIGRAFTIGWADAGSEGLDEDAAAVRQLATLLDTPIDFLDGADALDRLAPSGDLFADPAYGLTEAIARNASQEQFKVLLSGQGGDEVFAGYRRHQVARLLQHVRIGSAGQLVDRWVRSLGSGRLSDEYVARLFRAFSERDPFHAFMRLCTYSTAGDRARALDTTEAEVADEVVWQRHRSVFDELPPRVSFLRKIMALDLAVYLPGLGLSYVDRAGMEHGVEVRVPWLDLELVRWSLSLPDSSLIRHGRGKWLPRQLLAAEISPRVANRPKRGFATPIEQLRRTGSGGKRGLRQGEYFAYATHRLAEFRTGNTKSVNNHLQIR